MEIFSIEYALLAMQAALLKEVTSELRAVIVNLDKNDKVLYVRFYYDGEASEKKLDLWDCVIAEGSADLGPEFLLESIIERFDYPRQILTRGYYAYLRKENDSSKYKDDLCRKIEIIQMSLGYALLAVQYSLLGVVTPELRAVVVDYDKEKLLYIRFYYDGEVSKKLINLWHHAIKEVSGNFGPNFTIDGGVERVDYPTIFPFRGRYAYFRFESHALQPNELKAES